MLNAAAVLLCTSMAAATQNTVATVLRYRSITASPGDGIARSAEAAGGEVGRNRVSNMRASANQN